MVFTESGIVISYPCVYSFVCKAFRVFAAIPQSEYRFGLKWNLDPYINSNNRDCRPLRFEIFGL